MRIYGRIRQFRTFSCPRRHRARSTARPFTLEPHSTYILYGWGYFQYTQPDPARHQFGNHFYRLRRFLGKSDPCLPGGLSQRQATFQVIAAGERRIERELEIWRSLLTGYPTHVLRFGWKTPLGTTYNIIYLPLTFSFAGFYSDGLAKSFALDVLAAIERNQKLTWRLCPASNFTSLSEARLFWLAAGFAVWIESSLGIAYFDGNRE